MKLTAREVASRINPDSSVASDIENIKAYAQQVAQQALNDAAERAEVEDLTYYGETKTRTRVAFKSNTKSIPGIAGTIRVYKESITSTPIQLP